jgi:hypothetical protein
MEHSKLVRLFQMAKRDDNMVYHPYPYSNCVAI